jgi:hypothetical protein
MLTEPPTSGDFKLHTASAHLREGQLQVMDVRDIWANYKCGAFNERQLLMGLGRQVLTLKQPASGQESQMMMAERLTLAGAVTTNEAADAIELFLAWARDNAISVVD